MVAAESRRNESKSQPSCAISLLRYVTSSCNGVGLHRVIYIICNHLTQARPLAKTRRTDTTRDTKVWGVHAMLAAESRRYEYKHEVSIS